MRIDYKYYTGKRYYGMNGSTLQGCYSCEESPLEEVSLLPSSLGVCPRTARVGGHSDTPSTYCARCSTLQYEGMYVYM